MPSNDITIRVGTQDAGTKLDLDQLRQKLDDLGRKKVSATVNASTASAQVKLEELQLRLDRLSKMNATPRVQLQAARALLELDRVKSKIDDLPRERTVWVRVRTLGGVLSNGFLGGADQGSWLSRGMFNTGGASGLGTLVSNPYVLGASAAAAAAALPFAATAANGLITGSLGAGLAGLGIYGALSGGTGSTPAQIRIAQLQVQAAQQRLRALMAPPKSSGPAPGSVASAQAAILSAQGSLATAQGAKHPVASSIAAAQLRVQAARQRLSALMAPHQGKGAAPGSVASAQAALLSAQGNLAKLENNPANPGAVTTRESITDFINTLQGDIQKISVPFQAVIQNIVKAFGNVLPKLMTPLGAALGVIAKPLQDIGTTIADTLASPRVQQAIENVGAVFARFLTAFTPEIPGIVNALATGIASMANSFLNHPDMIIAMGKVIAFLFKLPGYAFSAIAALTNVAHWLATGLPHEVSRGVDDTRKFFENLWLDVRRDANNFNSFWIRYWDGFWNNSIGSAIRGGHNVEAAFNGFTHESAVIFDGARHEFSTIWDLIGRDTIGRVVQFLGVVVNWFRGLPGRIVRILGNAGSVLKGWGAGIINGLLNGARTVWNSVVNFFKGIPHDILHALGIASPPKWSIEAGMHIMNGIGIGLDKAKGAVTGILGTITGISGSGNPATALGGLGGSYGNEKAYAQSLMSRFGWSPMMMQYLIPLWNQESGWNPYAVNPSSGAYGIPQALGKGHPYNLGDWAAQINWGLNYIAGRYGSPLNAWIHEKQFNWYGAGGSPSGWAMAGEHGRELIRFPAGSRVYSNADTQRMLSGAGGVAAVQLEIHGGGSEFEQFMAQFIRNFVRVKGGGNVQRAFGRT